MKDKMLITDPIGTVPAGTVRNNSFFIVLIAALVAVLIPRTLSAQKDITPPTPLPGCESVRVTSTPTLTSAQTRKFSAKKILNVNFEAVFPAGDFLYDSLRVSVFTPRGQLYQVMDVPLKKDTGPKDETLRTVTGYPHPLKVEVPQTMTSADPSLAKRSVKTPPLAVGGTAIVTNGLYGTWRVEVLAAGSMKPCSQEFGITQ